MIFLFTGVEFQVPAVGFLGGVIQVQYSYFLVLAFPKQKETSRPPLVIREGSSAKVNWLNSIWGEFQDKIL